jgi:hypothetical protein
MHQIMATQMQGGEGVMSNSSGSSGCGCLHHHQQQQNAAAPKGVCRCLASTNFRYHSSAINNLNTS